MKHAMLDEKSIREAGFRLGKFMTQQQEWIESLLGIKVREVHGGPSTYEALLDVWQVGEDTFPVDVEHCDRTIYGTATANIAFRFWHDILHVFHRHKFDKVGELAVSVLHVEAVKAHFGPGSIEAQLMEADTMGQTLYHDLKGSFPNNQADFAVAYVQHGLSYCLTSWKDS